ncbi:hypothetical protein M2347_003860 [Chryseobacterium sp. H1D6B]|nr:hypothetical protein [Chryseobacterium sp. H1D6B]
MVAIVLYILRRIRKFFTGKSSDNKKDDYEL